MINISRIHIWRCARSAMLSGILFVLFPVFLYAAEPYVDTLRADVTLTNEGEVVVTETLEYMNVVPEATYERCFSVQHQDTPSSMLKYRTREISIERVVVDAAEVVSEIVERDGAMCASYVLPHTFTQVIVSYRIQGGLSYVPNAGAELYWSVGTDDIGILVRDVRVAMRQTDVSFTSDKSCYHGLPSKEESCRFASEDGALSFRGNLDRKGESIVVVLGVSPAHVSRVIFESYYPLVRVGGGMILLVLVGGLFFGVGRKKEVEPQQDIAYEPPIAFEPIQTGILLARSLQYPDIVGQIFLLAERGLVQIAYTPATQHVVMTRFATSDVELSVSDSTLLELIFGLAEEVTVSRDSMESRTAYQTRYHEVLPRLTNAIKKTLVQNGHIRYYPLSEIPSWWWVCGLSIVGIVSGVWSWTIGVSIAVILIVLMCVYALGLRTFAGRSTKDKVLRFAEYLRVPETQRFVLHNAPVMSAHHYLGYLPYSIALDVHHEWSQSFGQLSCAPTWLTTEKPPTTHDIDALADLLITTLDMWEVDVL